MDIANRIDLLIERHEISQQAVADAVGVSDQTISRWRHGDGKKGPSLAQAIRLAKKLGTSVEYLATGRDPAPAELTADELYLVQLYRDLNLTRAEAARRLSGATSELKGQASPEEPTPEAVRPRRHG